MYKVIYTALRDKAVLETKWQLSRLLRWSRGLLGSSYFCEYGRENVAAGTINNKSIPHNCAGGCVAVPLLRHHFNFTTNKTTVNTE
jgi:hypothetical protein